MSATEPRNVPERYRLGDHFIPKDRYIDPEFLQLEYDRIFARTWQMACRLEEIPDAGDYLEYEIGDQSILVVNRGEGVLKAYFNACPHRGMRLARGQGKVKELRCGFHGWCFDLDGRSTYVHEEADFGEDFDRGKVRLGECRLDTWAGWVFINMDPGAQPLLEWLSPLPESLDPFQIERMRYRWYKATIMPTNWKTVIDAFVEGYHTGATHPQNLRKFRIDHNPSTVEEMRNPPFYTPSVMYENHSRFLYGARPAADIETPRKVGNQDNINGLIIFTEYNAYSLGALANERDVRAAHRLGEKPIPEGKTAAEVLQELRIEEAEAAGIVWPHMTPEQRYAGQGNWSVFPNMVALVEPGNVLGYRVRPNGLDPDSCLFECWTLDLYPEGEEPKTERQFFEDWREHDGWGLLLPQDFRNFPDMTAGMHSKGFAGLRLNPKQEGAIYNSHRIADRFLFGEE
jgi:phenylpropionate dioxygenase-like ring-hydroxylating dioxygenase large terminal subunit